MGTTVVWFKRDLRVHDHAPLVHAARQGPVRCLYVVEPSLWRQPDSALQHYAFLRESLRDLAQQLRTWWRTRSRQRPYLRTRPGRGPLLPRAPGPGRAAQAAMVEKYGSRRVRRSRGRRPAPPAPQQHSLDF